MKKSLMHKTMLRFVIFVAALMLLATPLFYRLTKNYYAEDMIDIIEAVQEGDPIPVPDLEEDILHGIMIQFALIVSVIGIAVVLMMRFISARLWKPFDKTLEAIESFNLENGVCPTLPDSDTKEFSRLNTALNRLMTGNMKSYRTQKEFTENASHELQTPLAVFRSKLDILLQQPDLTENQAVIVQDLYQMTDRLSHLNRNLLLLAKMENSQFSREDSFDVVAVLNELLPCLESLAPGLTVRKDIQVSKLCLKANKSLFESLVNNLIVNAVRHNKPDGEIRVTVTSDSLSVSNTSNEPALDPATIFTRFNHSSGHSHGNRRTSWSVPSSIGNRCGLGNLESGDVTGAKVEKDVAHDARKDFEDDSAKVGIGNGLGLSIVKSICDYHPWQITYSYLPGTHTFTVRFGH